MKKTTNLIFYPSGCYGTFIEWIYYYFIKEVTYLPFKSDGSSHEYLGNFLCPREKLIEFINSDEEVKLARCSPDILNQNATNSNISNFEIIMDDLNYLKDKFNTILVIHPSEYTKLWVENNEIEKCIITQEQFDLLYKPYGWKESSMASIFETDSIKKLKECIKHELTEDKTQFWNKNDLTNLSDWEFRELMSLYWIDRQRDQYTCWKYIKKEFNECHNIKFLSLDELKKDSLKFVSTCLEYFNVPNFNLNELKNIIEKWKNKQFHMHKDEEIDKIVNCLSDNKNYNWENKGITFLDEVYIQKKLLDNNIGIKCFNLNVFPKNTFDFAPLLYKL